MLHQKFRYKRKKCLGTNFLNRDNLAPNHEVAEFIVVVFVAVVVVLEADVDVVVVVVVVADVVGVFSEVAGDIAGDVVTLVVFLFCSCCC